MHELGAGVDIQAFTDEGLGNSTYLVEVGDRRALVLDPPRDVSALQRAAEARGIALAYAVETHLHADFVSGSRELAATGATVVAARASGLAFPHRPLVDGDTVDLGGLALEAIATPGHTPEHLSYLLRDGSTPLALFSGGALLPGSVARTDLIAPDQTEALGRALYRSLHERILSLPDDLVVYPTHGSGSFCSTASGGERTTTIGRERAANPLLQAPDEDAFVARLAETFGSYPTYFRRLREVNRRGPAVLGGVPALPLLDLAAVDRRREAGAELIDVRPTEAYAAGHVPGSLSIALRPAFASWLGWLVPADRPLVFVLDGSQDRRDVVRQAVGIGYESLAGEIAGGFEAWRDAGRAVATTGLTKLPVTTGPVLDVRQTSEVDSGHVAGAMTIELGAIPSHLAEIPGGVTVMCGVGDRAMTAASLLERTGREATVFRATPDSWARATGEGLVPGT
jgi:glyoxylase-like metal-dependent hydrolase (beta-lactamase superfamily II)/rhodanese-related sulfurtransferase